MTKIKIFIVLLAISYIFVLAPSVKASLVGNTSQATMSLSPESGAYNVNTQFQITIYLNTNGLSVNAVAAHFNYSPSLFQVASIDYTGSIFTMQAESNINNSAGTVKISRGVTGNVNTSNGRIGVLNIIGLTAAAPSSDNFTFNFTAGDANKSNVFLPDNQGTPVLSGVYSGRYTISGGADITPPLISSVLASYITSSGATITWTTNELSNSQVEYGLNTSYGSQTALNASMVTSHSQAISGLSANTLYHYRVKSRDAAGNLANSVDYTFTTGTASCTSRSLVSSSVSPSSVTTGGTYTVTCNYGVTTNAINAVVGSGSCTFQNFSGTAARFSCTAGSTAGTFSNSCALSNMSPDYYCARTDPIANLTVTAVSDTTAPSVPANFSATAVSSSQINLTWTASTDNIGVTGYRIYRCQGSGCTPSTQIGTATTNSYSNTGLTANTTYVYRVTAYDAAGNISGQSTSASASTQAITTLDTMPPANITNLSVSDITQTSVKLLWTAPGDDANVGIANSYNIRYYTLNITESNWSSATQVSGAVSPVLAGSPQSMTVVGLSPGTTYYFAIKAQDEVSNTSGLSNVISAKTQGTATTPTPTPTPTLTSTAFTKDLYLGIKNSQVQALQELLAKDKTIYPEGVITGFYGILTQIAVQRFQCQYNIVCSGSPFTNGYGMVGPGTRAKLNELYAGTLQPTTPALPQTEKEQLIEQLKAQIKALQEKIVELLNQLVQLLQEEIKKSG